VVYAILKCFNLTVSVLLLPAASVAVSSWTLVAISCERYYAICHPLRSRSWQTISHAYKIIGFIWLGGILCMTPIAIFSQLIPTSRPGEYAPDPGKAHPVVMHLHRSQATASAANFGPTKATSSSTTSCWTSCCSSCRCWCSAWPTSSSRGPSTWAWPRTVAGSCSNQYPHPQERPAEADPLRAQAAAATASWSSPPRQSITVGNRSFKKSARIM